MVKAGWHSALARRMGMGGEIPTTTTRVGMTLHIPCKKGDHVVDVTIRPGLNPNGVVKHLLHLGWTCGTNPVCPEHGRRDRKQAPSAANTNTAITVREDVAVMATAAQTTNPTASDAAKRAKRMVYQALEDYYDDTKKAYRPGHSDESIAKETGAALDFVRRIREEDFGPLGTPPELQTLIDHVAAMRSEVEHALASYLSRLDSLNNRLATLCRAQGWPTPL